MSEIGEKQFLLTGYLEYLLKKIFINNRNENHSVPNGYANGVVNGHTNGTNNKRNNQQQQLPVVEIITPSDPKQRGSQLSLSFSVPLQLVQEELYKLGIVVSGLFHFLKNSFTLKVQNLKFLFFSVRHSYASCHESGSRTALQFL